MSTEVKYTERDLVMAKREGYVVGRSHPLVRVCDSARCKGCAQYGEAAKGAFPLPLKRVPRVWSGPVGVGPRYRGGRTVIAARLLPLWVRSVVWIAAYVAVLVGCTAIACDLIAAAFALRWYGWLAAAGWVVGCWLMLMSEYAARLRDEWNTLRLRWAFRGKEAV